MIQYLNLILLTAKELESLRTELRQISDTKDPETINFFVSLYKTWAYNAAATLSLCLFSQLYQHAWDLVQQFSQLEMTLPFLLEIDKLVQLLESPIFLGLRLQLLEPTKYPYLQKCLYGILMILPQSSAYETLKNRLTPTANFGSMNLFPEKPTKAKTALKIDFSELLLEFLKKQKH